MSHINVEPPPRNYSLANRNGSKPARKRHLPPEVLTPEEVQRLMDACSSRSTGTRNRALIAVLYRAGLRINEALSLLPKDLDARSGAVRVLNGKGGKSRVVGMDIDAFVLLQQWLEKREQRNHDPRTPVFCTLDGKQLMPSYIRVLIPRLAESAGILKRVHAHGLRHTHAAELRAEGLDIGIISKQLGHCSIATTAQYLDHIAPLAVLDALRKRCW